MWEGGLGESDEGVSPQTSIIDQTENDMRAYESYPRWEAKNEASVRSKAKSTQTVLAYMQTIANQFFYVYLVNILDFF